MRRTILLLLIALPLSSCAEPRAHETMRITLTIEGTHYQIVCVEVQSPDPVCRLKDQPAASTEDRPTDTTKGL